MVERTNRVVGFIEPCVPSPAQQPPTGADWLHGFKHDGFRILALRDRSGVRLYTRNGNDFTKRFPRSWRPLRHCRHRSAGSLPRV